MTNESKRGMYSNLGNLPGFACVPRWYPYRNPGVWRTFYRFWNDNNDAVEWIKCTIFAKEINWVGFKLSNKGTEPVERKADSILKMKKKNGEVLDIR